MKGEVIAVIAAVVIGVVLTVVGAWALFMAIWGYGLSESMGEAAIGVFATIFLIGGFVALVGATILFVWAFKRARSQKKTHVRN